MIVDNVLAIRKGLTKDEEGASLTKAASAIAEGQSNGHVEAAQAMATQ